jgi:hypothetical protein
MTTVDTITEQARQVRFWHSVATAVAFVLFGAGWLAAKGFGLLWFGLVWCACAVREGWREGRAEVNRGPSEPR